MELQKYPRRLKETTRLVGIQGDSGKDRNIFFTREECEAIEKRASSRFNTGLNIFLLGSSETLSNSSQDYITALAVDLFKMFAEEKVTKKGDTVYILKNSTGGFRILGRDLNEVHSRVFVQHMDELNPLERKATITLYNEQGFELSFILLTRMEPSSVPPKEKKEEAVKRAKEELTLLKDHVLFHNSKMESKAKREEEKVTPKELLKKVLELKDSDDHCFITSDKESFDILDEKEKDVLLTDDETIMVIWDIIRMHSTVENLLTKEIVHGFESVITPTTSLRYKTIGFSKLKQNNVDVICSGLMKSPTEEILEFSVTTPEYIKRLQYVVNILLK